jgi:hypothetical protein
VRLEREGQQLIINQPRQKPTYMGLSGTDSSPAQIRQNPSAGFLKEPTRGVEPRTPRLRSECSGLGFPSTDRGTKPGCARSRSPHTSPGGDAVTCLNLRVCVEQCRRGLADHYPSMYVITDRGVERHQRQRNASCPVTDNSVRYEAIERHPYVR